MIHLDLTTSAVSVEGDKPEGPLATVRTIQNPWSNSRVAQATPTGHREITESIRSRSGGQVLREYDIDEPGTYLMTSGRREENGSRDGEGSRNFEIRIERIDPEVLRVVVLPSSSACSWVVGEQVHHHHPAETFTFDVRVRHVGEQVEGSLARMESDQAGVTFNRTTAWERLLEDDNPDSV